MKKITEDLKIRIFANAQRLQSDIYQYPKVFEHVSEWPGDFEGRAMLALCSLYDALEGYKEEQDKIMNQLECIFSHLEEKLNINKYFGEIFNNKNVNEQQISGNSWYIRALVKYYNLTQNETALNYIKVINKTFLYKIAPFYLNYPLTRRSFGGVDGHLEVNETNGWIVSTDIGCAFIMLDGLVDTYSVLLDKKLFKIIDKLIDQFSKIDYVELECQTHATISCLRAILNFYQIVKDQKYLDIVKHIFDIYQMNGMTYDYQNINWFNRPNTWTEPCCIIDSSIVALNLYKITKDISYLKLFNKIYVNALRSLERDNGGAGCSTCAYDNNYDIKMFMYEAYFCCSMRLSEGLDFYCKNLIIKKEDGYEILFGVSFLIDEDGEDLSAYINYYYDNTMKFKSNMDTKLKIYIPNGIKIISSNAKIEKNKNFIEVEITKDVLIEIKYEFEIKKEHYFYYYGDMMLTKKAVHFEKIFNINNEKFSYITNSMNFNENELKTQVQELR